MAPDEIRLLSEEDAQAESLKFYKYEPENKYRLLVFHDEPWHWAMLKIFGETYWKTHPNFEHSSKEYEEKAEEIYKTFNKPIEPDRE